MSILALLPACRRGRRWKINGSPQRQHIRRSINSDREEQFPDVVSWPAVTSTGGMCGVVATVLIARIQRTHSTTTVLLVTMKQRTISRSLGLCGGLGVDIKRHTSVKWGVECSTRLSWLVLFIARLIQIVATGGKGPCSDGKRGSYSAKSYGFDSRYELE